MSGLVVELTREELEVLGRSLKYAEAWLIEHMENSPELPRIEGVRQVLFSAWEPSPDVEAT